MRNLKVFLIVIVAVLVFAIGIGSVVQSQDTGDVTCDSDLVLLWYVADRYFAFGAVQNSLAQTADPSTVLDFSRFNRGQYAPLFDALRNVQDPNTLTLPGVIVDPQWLSQVSTVIQMDAATFQDFVNSTQTDPSIASLVPMTIAGEVAECAQLRNQLQRFFTAVAVQDVQLGLTADFGLNSNNSPRVVATEEVNANANANDNTNVNTNDNGDDDDHDDNDNGDDDDHDDNSGHGGGDGSGGSGSGGSGSGG